jgi:hypothetical protein
MRDIDELVSGQRKQIFFVKSVIPLSPFTFVSQLHVLDIIDVVLSRPQKTVLATAGSCHKFFPQKKNFGDKKLDCVHTKNRKKKKYNLGHLGRNNQRTQGT